MRKKILLICYAFPPVSAAESFLAAKTLGHLSEFDIDVICTPPHPGLLANDDSLSSYVSTRFHQLYRVELPKWLSILFRSQWGRNFISLISHFPDKAVYLNRSAFTLAKTLDPSQYSTLITWSQFHSAHLVGLKLKRKYPKLRWLAHFSDPWVDNPFNRIPWLTKPVYRKMEAAVIQSCDLLLFTNQPSADLILKKYSSESGQKSKIIPHPFDPELYPTAQPSMTGKFILRYLGKFYGPRTAKPLLLALDKLERESPAILEQFQIELIGGNLGTNHHKNIIEVPPVDYLTSLAKMSQAHALLVIDANFDFSVFLPSKLVDYIGSKRPVFGITPDGVSKELILELGGKCAPPGDPEAIAALLVHIVKSLEKERMSGSPASSFEHEKVRERYSIRAITQLMNSVIEPH